MAESAKVELVIQKNGKPVKHPMSISQKVTFDSFFKKLERYTAKKYRVEYYSGDRWEELNATTFKPLIKNYQGEVINIRTDELDQSSVDNSELSHYSDNSSIVGDQAAFAQFQQEQKPIHTVDLAAEIAKALAEDKLPRKEGEVPKSHFLQTVKDVVYDIATFTSVQLHKAYRIVREEQQAIDLCKTCSECSSKAFKGPYYICLVCPDEYILCPECEARDTLPDKDRLKTHKWKSHPFAKIKRLAQTIKKKEVATISEVDIPYDDRRLKEIRAKAPFKTERQINKDLLKKFETLYQYLIENSYYHSRAYANPDNLDLDESVYHRAGQAPYFFSRRSENNSQQRNAQQDRSGTVTSKQNSMKLGSSIPPQNNSSVSESGQDEKPLTEKEKLWKMKKLKRIKLTEEQLRKYTSDNFENKSYQDVMEYHFSQK